MQDYTLRVESKCLHYVCFTGGKKISLCWDVKCFLIITLFHSSELRKNSDSFQLTHPFELFHASLHHLKAFTSNSHPYMLRDVLLYGPLF